MVSRKKMSVKKETLLDIQPITDAQRKTVAAYKKGKNLFLYGAAGTGKTFIALYFALKEALADKKQVYVVRSLVPTRDVGFLPGTIEEKSELYQSPYKYMVKFMFKQGSDEDFNSLYERLIKQGTIKFLPTSFLRGITLDNSIIIVDESQNLDFWELNSIITRVGQNSKIIFAGDIEQSDIRDHDGFTTMLSILGQMKEFECIEFGLNDIVRSGFIKSYLIAKMIIRSPS
jgi:predicted ribonuclease YlaK